MATREASLTQGLRMARILFAKRERPGTGKQREIHISEAQLGAALAAAFDMGFDAGYKAGVE